MFDTKKLIKFGLAFAAAAAFSAGAYADGDHDHDHGSGGHTHGHSDIEFEYHDGHIDIAFGPEGRVFEGDFQTTGLFEQFTDDPGFDTEELPGGVLPGDIISYTILGPLLYHTGNAFAPVPTGAAIQIEDALGNVLTVDGSTTSGSGIVAQAFDAGNGRGDVHAHIDFSLIPLSLEIPEYGAYGIEMAITTDQPGIEDSDSFFIVFNFGLEEDESAPGPHFHDAVEDFAAVIPEPTSGLALLAGAGLLAARRRR